MDPELFERCSIVIQPILPGGKNKAYIRIQIIYLMHVNLNTN